MKQNFSSNPPRLDLFAEIPLVSRLADCYRLLHLVVKTFPKLDRHSLGQILLQKTLGLIETIILASRLRGPTKREVLLRAATQLDLVKLLIRLACESGACQDKDYIALEAELFEIGKMLGGWLRSLN